MLHGNSCATLTNGTAVPGFACILIPFVIVAAMYVQVADLQFLEYHDTSCVIDKHYLIAVLINTSLLANPFVSAARDRRLALAQIISLPVLFSRGFSSVRARSLVKSDAHDPRLVVQQMAEIRIQEGLIP